jgi:hypothetical protein
MKPMKKESRVIMTEAQHEALNIAAQKLGMKLATYLRWCGLNYASKNGIHAEQPKVDHG